MSVQILFLTSPKNKSFSITIPGHWETRSDEKTIDELNKSLEFRSENGIDLHVDQVRKKVLILMKDYSVSSLGMFKDELLEEIKKVKYNDLKDMVYRFQLTYDEIIDILDLKYILITGIGYSLNPGIYEKVDLNNTLNYISPNKVKVTVTIDDIRL